MTSLRALGLFVVVAFAMSSCYGDGDKDPDVELSLTRPLLLPNVPDYLEEEPEVDEIEGTLYIQYRGASAADPLLFLQEFEAPDLEALPERPDFGDPTFEGALEDAPTDSYFAAWRCGRLGLSTLISWEEPEPSSDRSAIVEELADLLASACANPASVPTPT